MDSCVDDDVVVTVAVGPIVVVGTGTITLDILVVMPGRMLYLNCLGENADPKRFVEAVIIIATTTTTSMTRLLKEPAATIFLFLLDGIRPSLGPARRRRVVLAFVDNDDGHDICTNVH
jgi:hypothetical protein